MQDTNIQQLLDQAFLREGNGYPYLISNITDFSSNKIAQLQNQCQDIGSSIQIIKLSTPIQLINDKEAVLLFCFYKPCMKILKMFQLDKQLIYKASYPNPSVPIVNNQPLQCIEPQHMYLRQFPPSFGIVGATIEREMKACIQIIPYLKRLILIDFECYSGDLISEVGYVVIDSGVGVVATKQYFVKLDLGEKFEPRSVSYVFDKITGIPPSLDNETLIQLEVKSYNMELLMSAAHSTIQYTPVEQIFSELQQFIGESCIFAAKGKQLEERLLQNYLGSKQVIYEVIPLIWTVKNQIITDFPVGSQKCSFHSQLPDQYHCALSDVNRFVPYFI